MSERVVRLIEEAIAEHGSIGFERFMELALYGPGGFFEHHPVGAHGHFVTSPHVHPVFGQLLGVGLELLHRSLGRPDPFRIVEVGAGDGALARELVAGFSRGGVGLDYVAVERSPGAREALARLAIRICERLREVGPIDVGVVLANELLDNLPFMRVRRTEDGLVEVRVGLGAPGARGGRFAEVEVPAGELEPFGEDLSVGEETTVPVGALAFVDELGDALVRGFAVLIDYGSDAGPSGAAHGYRHHRVVGDVLADPGGSDITAGVDLGTIARRATERGLIAFPTVSQRAALGALGFDEWTRGELDRQSELLSAGRGSEAVRTWGGRSRASLLVDPAGLGRLRWLVLATPGLDEPAWLRDARAVERGPG